MILGKMKKIIETFRSNGFIEGRMISGSKSGYRQRHPENDVVFNARIFISKQKEPIWWGDLDITLDSMSLQQICNEIGMEMLVFHESVSWYAEKKKYSKLEEHAHAKFIPNSTIYYSKIYDGFHGLQVDKMTVITSKGVSWIEKEINKE